MQTSWFLVLASLNAVNGHKMIDQFEEFQSLRLHCAWQYEPTSGWNSLSLKWNATQKPHVAVGLPNKFPLLQGKSELSDLFPEVFNTRVAIISISFTRSFLKGLSICKLPFRAGGAEEAIRFPPWKWFMSGHPFTGNLFRDLKVRLERLRRFPFMIPPVSVIPFKIPVYFSLFAYTLKKSPKIAYILKIRTPPTTQGGGSTRNHIITHNLKDISPMGRGPYQDWVIMYWLYYKLRDAHSTNLDAGVGA